jgi:hypothetical protein
MMGEGCDCPSDGEWIYHTITCPVGLAEGGRLTPPPERYPKLAWIRERVSHIILGGLIGGLMAMVGFGLLTTPVKTILGVAFVGAVAAAPVRHQRRKKRSTIGDSYD